jgi:opine dehydrogenase
MSEFTAFPDKDCLTIPDVIITCDQIRIGSLLALGCVMKVAVLGAGAGGAAAVAELVNTGHEVRFWGRSAETLAPHQAIGGVAFEGELSEGIAKPKLITTDIEAAVANADVAVVALPTFSHSSIASALANCGWSADKPIVLNPGHRGGALEFAETFTRGGKRAPAVVEFSTLTYVARKHRPDGVRITGRAKQVKAAALNGGSKEIEVAAKLFPGATPVSDVIASGLSNVNMILHSPGAVLAAAWVEATGGNFTFYVDAMTLGVARTMRRLDEERLAVAGAFAHQLPNLIEEMKLIGTVEATVSYSTDFHAAIAGGKANGKIKGPDSLEHLLSGRFRAWLIALSGAREHSGRGYAGGQIAFLACSNNRRY